MGNKLTLKEVLVIKYTTEYDAITNCEGVNK